MTSIPSKRRNATSNSGRSVVSALVIAFGLIALGFVASALYGQVEASAIDEEVLEIETNSLPSIEHLAEASTALRQIEAETDQYADQLPAEGTHERRAADAARRDLDHELAAYLETPMYPGERLLYGAVAEAVAGLDRAVTEIFESGPRDPARARSLADKDLRQAVKDADHAVHALSALNASQLHEELARIARVRGRTIAHALWLDSACLLFSIGAAAVAIRAARRQHAVERAHEELLEARANELEQFATRVAHDLLSPLAAVSFTLSSVRRNAARGDSIVEPLARANASLKRSQRLVDGILDFARAGATPASAGPADLREAIDGVVEEARSDEDATLEIGVEPFTDVELGCAPGVLTSVLSNLVRNAAKYVGPGPERRIVLRAAPDGEWTRVEVEDTGPGLPPGLEAHVFEPYVRGADNRQPGLGLGLATVRRFVEGNGGRVGVRSSPHGCVFWFELPSASLAARARASGPAKLAPRASAPRGNGTDGKPGDRVT